MSDGNTYPHLTHFRSTEGLTGSTKLSHSGHGTGVEARTIAEWSLRSERNLSTCARAAHGSDSSPSLLHASACCSRLRDLRAASLESFHVRNPLQFSLTISVLSLTGSVSISDIPVIPIAPSPVVRLQILNLMSAFF